MDLHLRYDSCLFHSVTRYVTKEYNKDSSQISKFYCDGLSDGLVVRVHAFYSNNLISIPAEANIEFFI